MPTPKQMDKLAATVATTVPPQAGLAPNAELPPEYWQSLLEDAHAQKPKVVSQATLTLSQLTQHPLRVGCHRCGRIVEIQKADATRLYGANAIWKDVGQRLLNNTCTQRTGRHEDDGCWADYAAS